MEQSSLKRLGEVVRPHILGGTVHDPQVALIHLVVDKEVSDIKRPSTLARAGLTVLCQDDARLVVLVQDIVPDVKPLHLQKESGPQHG